MPLGSWSAWSATWRRVLGLMAGGAVLGGAALYGGAAAAGSGTAPAAGGHGRVRTIAAGLRIPWGLAFLPDGTALVTERGNDVVPPYIVTVGPGEPVPPPPPVDRGVARILSVTPRGTVREVQRLPEVSTVAGEGGLLGIAVSPAYARDGWVYVYYTTEADNRVARLRLGQRPVPILTGIPITPNTPPEPGVPGIDGRFHPGGRIAFGPDGMLYVTTGEGYLEPELAQDPRSLGGKILRITPNGRPAPGNPGGTPVWSLGHRDPQGLAWDDDGGLYATDFGEDTWDELNVIRPGGNYGWPRHEGLAHDPRFVDPIATWRPADASPSGIAVHRDRIYIACLRGQRLYRVGLDGRDAQPLLAGEYGRLRTVEPAPDGSLWLLTSNRDGRGTPTPEDDRILRLTVGQGYQGT